MADAGAGGKLKVFISYSHKDSTAFADELLAGLEVAGFAPFLDRHDIVAGENWEKRLGGLIEQSDTVVFVISPEAVKSERCVWEVDRTIDLSKRVLPVIFKPVPTHEIPEKLSRLQFVSFDSGRGVTRPLAELADALRQDLDWIREHTRLGEIAGRWDKRGRPESLLLRGDEIDAASKWIASRNPAAPEITDTQRAFVKASEQAEATRLGKERAQIEATARLQRRIAWLLGGVAVLVLALFGYVTWQSYDVAQREIKMFTARATEALNDQQFERAIRYALERYPAHGRLPWTTPFSTELEGTLAASARSARLQHLLKGVLSVAFSDDGRRVVTGEDAAARIWDAESGEEIAELRGHSDDVKSAAFSPDGKRVVTGSDDQTARIWDAESGKQISVLKGHADKVWLAAFSRDGKRIVTTSSDGTARIWDAGSAKQIAVLKGHTDAVTFAAFSGDGERVVTASADRTARIWHVENDRSIAILKGHADGLFTATFSDDGRRVVTTSRDRTARIWDAESGMEIAILNIGQTRLFSLVFTAEFSRDGKRVVTGGTTPRASGTRRAERRSPS